MSTTFTHVKFNSPDGISGKNINSVNNTSINLDYVALGENAAKSLTSGIYNVFIGNNSGYNTTAAAENTAVGYNSLLSNTTGSSNVAIGTSALASNTTTNDSTAIGYHALELSTGAKNTALGQWSGHDITTGSYNVIIGPYPATAYATSSQNILISDGAQYPRLRVNNYGAYCFNPSTPLTDDFGVAGQVLMSNGNASPPIWQEIPGGSSSATVTANGGSNVEIVGMFLSATSYRSVEFTIQATYASTYNVSKLLVIHDGTNTVVADYGFLSLPVNNPLSSSIVADISAGNIRLLLTPYNNNTIYKIIAQPISI